MNNNCLFVLLIGVLIFSFSCSFTNSNAVKDMQIKVKKAEAGENAYREQFQKLKEQNETLVKNNESLKKRLDSLVNITSSANASFAPIRSPEKIGKIIQEENEYDNKAIKIDFKNITYDAYIVNDPNTIQFFWQKQNLSTLHQLKEKIERQKQELLFATNAGMYMPSLRPQGLYVEEGKEIVPIDLEKDKYGNFYMQPNGIFLITKEGRSEVITTNNYLKYDEEIVQYATQSGPMLVIDGIINEKFSETATSTYVRSGVGIDEYGRTVFLISNRRVNLYSFANIFLNHFGCKNALYLDGAISQMYLPLLNRRDLGGPFGAMIGVIK